MYYLNDNARLSDTGYSSDIDIKSPSSRFVRKRAVSRQESSPSFLGPRGEGTESSCPDDTCSSVTASLAGKKPGLWKECGKCPLKQNSCHICGLEFFKEGTRVVFVFAEDPPEVKCIMYANSLKRKTYVILCIVAFFLIIVEAWLFLFKI